MQALGSNPFLKFTGEILRKSLFKDKEKKWKNNPALLEMNCFFFF